MADKPKVSDKHPLARRYEPWVDKGWSRSPLEKLTSRTFGFLLVFSWITYAVLFLARPWFSLIGFALFAFTMAVFGSSVSRRSHYAKRERRLVRRHAKAVFAELEYDETIHHYAVAFEAPAYGHSRLSGAFESMHLEHRELVALVTDKRLLVLRPPFVWGRAYPLHSVPKSQISAVRFEPSRALIGSKNEGFLKSSAAGGFVTAERHGKEPIGLRLTDQSEARTFAEVLQRLRGGEDIAGAGALALNIGGAEEDGALSLPKEEGGLSATGESSEEN